MTTDPPTGSPPAASPLDRVRQHAPWLLEESLGTCVVGSAALAEACRRQRARGPGVRGPGVQDLDLAWGLPLPDAQAELERRGVYLKTTEPNRARGTLALRLGGERVEITSFRDADSGGSHGSRPDDAGAGDRGADHRGDALADRIHRDLARRDMTIGAVAWQLATDAIHDPFHGVDDWQGRRIEPVGDPRERVAEHPVRWIRYFRRAHALGFALASKVRKLGVDRATLARIPAEAVAQELRRALLDLDSPGRFLLELHEAGGLVHLCPELAPQFDGRAAGPVRHHPEVSQALHLILALEWAVDRSRELTEPERVAVLVAVLCHDLGKGLTADHLLPAHHGHEHDGAPLVLSLLDRLPGLTDAGGRRLAVEVCELHLAARRLRQMRSGTLAHLYDRHFRDRDLPVRLFALAVAADCAGRLGRADEGDAVARQVEADIRWLRGCCESVDARALRARFPDTDHFREALHEARAKAIGTGAREAP